MKLVPVSDDEESLDSNDGTVVTVITTLPDPTPDPTPTPSSLVPESSEAHRSAEHVETAMLQEIELAVDAMLEEAVDEASRSTSMSLPEDSATGALVQEEDATEAAKSKA